MRLYAQDGQRGAIGPYVNLTVTRGEGATTFGDCAGFTTTGTGDGEIYSGTLAAFPAGYTDASGIVDPQSWGNERRAASSSSSRRSRPTTAAQAASGAADFAWQARNT